MIWILLTVRYFEHKTSGYFVFGHEHKFHKFTMQATSAGFRGDQESVRSNNNLSYGATVASIVSSVIGVGIFLGLVFGIWYRPYYLL